MILFPDDVTTLQAMLRAERAARLSNNAAERELRAVAVGRRNWTSDEGGRRAAAIYTLIASAKLNDIVPQALACRRPGQPAGSSCQRIHELLPWNWQPQSFAHAA